MIIDSVARPVTITSDAAPNARRSAIANCAAALFNADVSRKRQVHQRHDSKTRPMLFEDLRNRADGQAVDHRDRAGRKIREHLLGLRDRRGRRSRKVSSSICTSTDQFIARRPSTM